MKKRTSLKKVIIISLLGIGGWFFLKDSALGEKIVTTLSYPFILIQYKVITPLMQIPLFSKSYVQLQQQLEKIEAEKQALWIQNVELQSLLLENEECQELLDFKKKYRHEQGIIARVILKNFDENHHFFLVDAGSKRGIKKDMVVVCQSFLLGKVTDVYPYYSRVILITDKACKVAAVCTQTQAPGIHEGINSLDETRLAFVSHLEELEKDDLVISAGEGLIFPRGFALGTIENFERDGFSYRVHVKPLLDFKTIELCYIFEKGAEFST